MKTLTSDTSLKSYSKAFVIGTKEHAEAIEKRYSITTHWLENSTATQHLLHGGMTALNCVIAVIGSQEHAYMIGLWRNVSRSATNFFEVNQTALAGVVIQKKAEPQPTPAKEPTLKSVPHTTPIKVAAIMPAYNQHDLLHKAIASIANQIDLLVIVNDGSNDGTTKLLSSPTLSSVFTYITHTEHRGVAESINTGIQLATTLIPPGQELWLTWVSPQDRYKPDWRERMEEEIHQHKLDELGAVYSGYAVKKPKIKKSRTVNSSAVTEPLIDATSCLYGPSFLIRSDIWPSHRGKGGHDYDAWLRIEDKCKELGLKIIHVPGSLCTHIDTGENIMNDLMHWQDDAKARR